MTQSIADHPTVRRLSKRPDRQPAPQIAEALDAAWLRQMCLDAGADDVGFVAIDRPELDTQRSDILQVFPQAGNQLKGFE